MCRRHFVFLVYWYLFGGRDEPADFAQVHGVGAPVVALLGEHQSLPQAGVGLLQPDGRARGPEQRPVEVLAEPERRAQHGGQGQPRDERRAAGSERHVRPGVLSSRERDRCPGGARIKERDVGLSRGGLDREL